MILRSKNDGDQSHASILSINGILMLNGPNERSSNRVQPHGEPPKRGKVRVQLYHG